MKIRILCATVAISCCGLSSSQAQVRILGGFGQPTPAPKLVSDRTDVGDDELFTGGLGEITEAVNPFDFLPNAEDGDIPLQMQQPAASAAPAAPTATQPLQPSENDAAIRQPATDFFGNDNNSDSDPQSLPVGRHHGRSIVDTIVDYSTVDSIPHAAFAPVAWAPMRAPQPVADILLREPCVAGLWATYPQERAQDCANMWSHLNGHGHGGCGHAGCGHAGAGCNSCGHAAHAVPRNRYLEQAHGGCVHGGCATGACGNGQCDSISAAPRSMNVLPVSTNGPGVSMQFNPTQLEQPQQVVAPPQEKPANVARLLPQMMR